MGAYIIDNINCISMLFVLIIFLNTNIKIIKNNSAMTLSYKPYMFGMLSSFVLYKKSELLEVTIIMGMLFISSLITALHIIYKKRNSDNTIKDDFRIYLIAAFGSVFGIFGSSLTYLSIINLKTGLSSVSITAIMFGIINYLIILIFIAEGTYVVLALSITVILQLIVIIATIMNNYIYFNKERILNG